MRFKQGELFWGMEKDFVKSITDLAVHISCKKGEKLFDIGEPAEYFYMLLKGSVIMERGKDKLYTADHAGELFGWSSLIHRPDYAASATIAADSDILKIESRPFLDLLETSPKNKAILFEQLSRKLGNQLLNVYIAATC